MATGLNDTELLREYLHRRSEEAFRELVRRHTDLVFGTALRRTSDPGAAEEITQNTFVVLARKAIWLQSQTSLAGWLYRTALLESRQWWRGEARRQRREEVAGKLETTMKTGEQPTHALSETLDEALMELRDGDRQALLLRFFEGRNHREIGRALNIGEDAARKRVDKGLEQLAAFFRKRGVAMGTAAAVGTTLGATAAVAPTGLAAAAAQAALAKSSIATVPLLGGMLARMLGMNRWQVAVTSAALILLPALWQAAQLHSANQEQKRMELLLASLESHRDQTSQEMAEISRQLQALTNRVALAEATAAGAANGLATSWTNLDPQLFHWDEKAEYVRVPKEQLRYLAFDGSDSSAEVGSYPEEEKMIGTNGKISPTLLNVLGLSEDEQKRLQQYMEGCAQQYRSFAESHAEIKSIDAFPAGAPSFVETNADTRLWMMPQLAGVMTDWTQQFKKGIAEVAGDERAAVILQQATEDGSLNKIFQNFGSSQPLIVLTPLPGGGCSLAYNFPRDGQPRWQGGYKIATSKILGPYDDGDSGLIKLFMGRPVPDGLVEYLREWQEGHPEVPDAATQTTSKNP